MDSSRRPQRITPSELGFTPRRPVAWLRPELLANTAIRAGLAQMFGAYLDKRELQGALPSDVYRHDAEGDLWLDYVADLGDGFDATYSIAWLLAQEQLSLADPTADPAADPTAEPVADPVQGELVLPRGQLLVMGGDQVYPTADWRQYEDRAKGPYRAALPEPTEDRPVLYALPGNHDWYDGLTAFLRLFGRGESIGGWRTAQSRSYFAIELPRRWWLFAIDAQFNAYLDEPQLKYFSSVAERLEPGDQVILCTPRPNWVHASEVPYEYDTIDYFLRKVIAPTGAVVPLLLSGDSHHYARYHAPDVEEPAGVGEQPAAENAASTATQSAGSSDRHLVICGGGGAYLAATHMLPDAVEVPPKKTLVRSASPTRRYQLKARYPDAERSRRYAWGVFWRLPRHNLGFVAVLGAMHTLLLAAYVSAATGVGGVPWFTVSALGMTALFLLTGVGFAAVDREGPVRARHVVIGVLHGLAHIGLASVGAWLWDRLGMDTMPMLLQLGLPILVYAPIAGLLATELVCVNLVIAQRFGVNVNELFSSQGIQDAKSFLRIRIGRDGSLTVYPIAVDEVCRTWRATPDDPPHTPWLAPDDPLRPRLIEAPVVVPSGRHAAV